MLTQDAKFRLVNALKSGKYDKSKHDILIILEDMFGDHPNYQSRPYMFPYLQTWTIELSQIDPEQEVELVYMWNLKRFSIEDIVKHIEENY